MPRFAGALIVMLASAGCGYVPRARDGTPRPLKDARDHQVYGMLRGIEAAEDGGLTVVFDVVNAGGWPMWICRLGPVSVQFQGRGDSFDFALGNLSPERHPQLFLELPEKKTARLRYGLRGGLSHGELESVTIDVLMVAIPSGRVVPDPPKWRKEWRTLQIYNPAFLDAVAKESEIVYDASWHAVSGRLPDVGEYVSERALKETHPQEKK